MNTEDRIIDKILQIRLDRFPVVDNDIKMSSHIQSLQDVEGQLIRIIRNQQAEIDTLKEQVRYIQSKPTKESAKTNNQWT